MNWPYRKLKDSKILEVNFRFVSNFSTQPRGLMSVVSGMQVQRYISCFGIFFTTFFYGWLSGRPGQRRWTLSTFGISVLLVVVCV
jgi:hypothetical protein